MVWGSGKRGGKGTAATASQAEGTVVQWLSGVKKHGTSQEPEKTSILGQTEQGGKWEEKRLDP